MTLNETIARMKSPLKVGDHEVVLGDDGLGHLIVVIEVLPRTENLQYLFMSKCNNVDGPSLGLREVAPSITCVKCLQW